MPQHRIPFAAKHLKISHLHPLNPALWCFPSIPPPLPLKHSRHQQTPCVRETHPPFHLRAKVGNCLPTLFRIRDHGIGHQPQVGNVLKEKFYLHLHHYGYRRSRASRVRRQRRLNARLTHHPGIYPPAWLFHPCQQLLLLRRTWLQICKNQAYKNNAKVLRRFLGYIPSRI